MMGEVIGVTDRDAVPGEVVLAVLEAADRKALLLPRPGPLGLRFTTLGVMSMISL
jgi:hypothetical protein